MHLQLAIDVRALGEDEPLVSRGGGRNARVECVGVRRRQEEIPCADARVVREGRGRVRAPGYAGVRAVFARAGRGCWGDGGGRENCCEMGSEEKEPAESTRICFMNVVWFQMGLVLRAGSDGGVSGMRSSCRSVERRCSFRGERGDGGD